MIQEQVSPKAFLDNALHLTPEGLYSRYGCMITFEEKGQKQALRYKLDIKYLGMSNTANSIFRLDRSAAVYINDKLPETTMDDLAAKVSQVIYPLDIETQGNGALRAVVNFEAIQKRWETLKAEIRLQYKGELIEKYIAMNDVPLKYPDIFFAKIAQDWFIHLFFTPLYLNYGDRLKFGDTAAYYIAGNAGGVNYNVIRRVNENPSGPRHFANINGVIHDERCALDLEQELTFPYFAANLPEEKQSQSPLVGSCDITYAIHKETGVVTGIEGYFDTQFMAPKKVTVKMFALGALKEKAPLGIEDGKKEDNFWKRFFKKSNKS